MMEEPDLRKPAGARAVLDLIAMEKPDLVVMAPPSGPWGPWSRRWLGGRRIMGGQASGFAAVEAVS